ncbi:MAG: HPr kinase/phosphorylase [Rhizobiaceae bacterium]|nr:HPr kinase/phosphorylase [Rhizobiaceae bacterium]
MPTRPENIHATALVVGDRGLLITGRSGAGKTALALALIARATAAGRFAALVSDDRLLASAHAGRLVVRPPDSIAGLVEVRGRTPAPIAHAPVAVVDLVVSLLEAEAPRYAEPESTAVAGCAVAHLRLAERSVEAAMPALASWLSLPPFSR